MFLQRRIFQTVKTFCYHRMSSSTTKELSSSAMNGLNSDVTEEQISQLSDLVPLVDSNDKVLGPSSKKDCHIRRGNEDGLLHRAFSVFLFNSRKELLLQQRSSSKITFPNYYTNTCCSHPRFYEDELQEVEHQGIRCAAQRRMNFELGIPTDEVPIDSFDVITRVHYSADSNGQWCEHEIDYILICQKDVNLDNVNTDEVQKVLYKNKEEFKVFMETTVPETGLLITPWFNYIVNNFLYTLWDNLDDLSKCKNDIIHRAGKQT